MTKDQYRLKLESALQFYNDEVATRIRKLLANLPARARALDVVIFPPQDADGTFLIRASVDGPDLYVINKAIVDYADILDASFASNCRNLQIPLVDQNEADFFINDVLAECVMNWLEQVWKSLGVVHCPVPVRVISGEIYGAWTPRKLHEPEAHKS